MAHIISTINENRDRLNNISKEIWSNPEGSFEEKHAHNILTQFFTEEGFEVERNYIYATGFRATFGSSEGETLIVVSMASLYSGAHLLMHRNENNRLIKNL